MKTIVKFTIFTAAILLSGCTTPPPAAVYLTPNSLASQPGRLGIVMTPLPKVDVRLPGVGVGCLLCMAAATVSNATLATHVRSLSYEDLSELKEHIAQSLRKKGANVTVIEEDLNVEKLPEASAGGPNIARKDFSPLQKKYNVDKLLVIDINTLGVSRTYSAYFATSDPEAVMQGAGYIVNLQNNSYEWYMPINIVRSPVGDWNQPPDYPRLTKAFRQALKTGKDNFTRPFEK